MGNEWKWLKLEIFLFRARLRPQTDLEKHESIAKQGDVKNRVKEFARVKEHENECKNQTKESEKKKKTLLGDEVQFN